MNMNKYIDLFLIQPITLLPYKLQRNAGLFDIAHAPKRQLGRKISIVTNIEFFQAGIFNVVQGSAEQFVTGLLKVRSPEKCMDSFGARNLFGVFHDIADPMV
ncbi:hypothetical protein SDC9_196418 [bioreactor metagenome]|uniref:Uncharacterized protein n=1 Tax=bioreactor metagenome TaxID=1076179 RepID=A0A645ID16_9ZZZZ